MNHSFGFIKAAAANFRTAVANPAANAAKICALLGLAQKQQCDLVVFPELALSGYTCGDLFLQSTLIAKMEEALAQVVEYTAAQDWQGLVVLGAAVRQCSRLFNAAVVLQHGRILGVVPKTYLPNYSEFYEKRWFQPACLRCSDELELCSLRVPFTPRLIVEVPGGLNLCCELCEDLWVNLPPSSLHTLAGACVVANPSASDEIVTKSAYRRDLVRMQSGHCLCAYVYASAGAGESSTDLVYSGHKLIASSGALLSEVKEDEGLCTAVLDLQKLEHDRMQNNSSFYAEQEYREILASYVRVRSLPLQETGVLPEAVNPRPFVPAESERLERSREIMHLQASGLAQRLGATGLKRLVVGISGGLDSTLALLIAAEACRRLSLPPEAVLAVTMPGFGTSAGTKEHALKLMERLGAECRTIDIVPACLQHFKDIGHDPENYDVTYQNVQARERTQILMDLANAVGGLVVGTGDLSESALGWSTYNGDHMSMYAVNTGVPKTLVKYLVRACGESRPELRELLDAICATEISPELLPPGAGGSIQSTEGTIGKYDLHDFFLFHFVRNGASREKIAVLARIAYPDTDPGYIDHTLEIFFRRFFTQQFKRSCIPDGPKVGTLALSPRGDWRMPSDADCVF